MLTYSAQFNKMLKYKNVKFLHTFCKQVRAFAQLCRTFANKCALLHPFFDVFFLPLLPIPPMLPIDIHLQTKIEHAQKNNQKNPQFLPIF